VRAWPIASVSGNPWRPAGSWDAGMQRLQAGTRRIVARRKLVWGGRRLKGMRGGLREQIAIEAARRGARWHRRRAVEQTTLRHGNPWGGNREPCRYRQGQRCRSKPEAVPLTLFRTLRVPVIIETRRGVLDRECLHSASYSRAAGVAFCGRKAAGRQRHANDQQ
jgi:hypothetical protein